MHRGINSLPKIACLGAAMSLADHSSINAEVAQTRGFELSAALGSQRTPLRAGSLE